MNPDPIMVTGPKNSPPIMPLALQVNFDAIPAEMQTRRQWVVWKFLYQSNKTKPWTKVPYDPRHGTKASHSDSNTWGSFDEAVQLYSTGTYEGIGYVFSQDDPYCGIDLDDCRKPADGEIAPEKRRYVDQVASYTEISPSGRGLHIILKAKLPSGGRKRAQLSIEIYDRQRYFCVTGHRLDGMPADPQLRQSELENFYAEIFGPEKAPAEFIFEPNNSPLTVAEKEILKKAFANPETGEKIMDLYVGKWKEAGYPSQSEADLALCNYLTL